MKRIILLIVVLILSPVNILLAQSAVHPWRIIDAGGGRSTTTSGSLISSVGQIFVGSGETDSGTVHLEAGGIPGTRVLTGVTASFVSLTGQSWNMLSVPLLVADYHTAILYPSAISSAFAFSGNAYVIRDTLENATGYWLKFAGIDTVTFSGTGLTKDTVNVQAGWNMIGSVYFPLYVSDVTPIPPVTISGDFYGFSSAAGYSPVDTLNPGKAYWVKVSHSGRLVLNSGSVLDDPATRILVAGGPARKLERKSSMVDEEIRVLTVKDSRGINRSLRYSSGQIDVEPDALELPPIPPAGVFDIRFASQRAVEFATQKGGVEEFPILINGAVYPVTITWEDIPDDQDVELIFTHVGKAAEQHPLRSKGSFVITDNRFLGIKLALKVREAPVLPKFFALHQNYPNPFNPSTMMNYQLPVNSYVTLKVYNLLGQEVATLVDEIQEAGFRSVEWDASRFASGVYVYRLEAGGSVYTKKMLLLR